MAADLVADLVEDSVADSAVDSVVPQFVVELGVRQPFHSLIFSISSRNRIKIAVNFVRSLAVFVAVKWRPIFPR